MESSSNSTEDTFKSMCPDPFEDLIEDLELQPFVNIRSLQKVLNDRWDALKKDCTQDQFLAFTNVPDSITSHLSSDDDSCRVTKIARLSYNTVTNTLIVKIMIHPLHEFVSEAFAECIMEDIHAMGLKKEVERLGSTSTQIGNWVKEADKCWGFFLPSQKTQIHLTTVLEVGLLESSQRLALDAKGWLETKGSTVSTVITLDVSRNPNAPQIIIKCWELGSRVSSISAQKSPLSAYCSNETRIVRTNNATTVSGDLTISFEKVVSRPRNPGERDFFISQYSLGELAEGIWTKQGYM